MKFLCLLLICGLAVVMAQTKTPPKTQVFASGGGSRKQGFDVNVDVQRNIWQSQNKRHSVDGTAGVSQHLGGPYGNSKPSYRGGVQYKYNFGK